MIARLPIAAFALALLAGSAPEPARLHLTLDGLRSSKGSVRLCIWRDSEGFPDCRKNSSVIHEAVPAAPVVELDLAILPPGDYGISAMHDENDNRKLDKSFIGLPTEGVAFSNNARIRFGPPRFEQVRFNVDGDARHTMHMRYFL
jgi:uncharacterized protein (DUF2141 family)